MLSVAMAQNDSAKVYPNFRFTDGVYLTFEDFRNNRPYCTDFAVSYRGGGTRITKACADSSTSNTDCEIKDPWGYCLNHSVFINQGYRGNYFRLQVVGALIHYFVMEMDYFDPSFSDPFNPHSTTPNRRLSNLEMVMEWETGKSFEFCYKNFKYFLLEKDIDLYKELETSKKKRKMIYFYMLKYNEKHPVFTNLY